MASAAFVSVEEYLNTSYRPDCDYVDGRIVERNLGEQTHSAIQRELIVYLHGRSREWGIEVLPGQRVLVSATRVRVPDIAVLGLPVSEEGIVTSPPHLCIEILSKDDTMEDMQERIEDHLRFGVPYIWVISPRRKKAYVVTRAGMVEAMSGCLETRDPDISVPFAVFFE
jgi:Uma2 family endonuclease